GRRWSASPTSTPTNAGCGPSTTSAASASRSATRCATSTPPPFRWWHDRRPLPRTGRRVLLAPGADIHRARRAAPVRLRGGDLPRPARRRPLRLRRLAGPRPRREEPLRAVVDPAAPPRLVPVPRPVVAVATDVHAPAGGGGAGGRRPPRLGPGQRLSRRSRRVL